MDDLKEEVNTPTWRRITAFFTLGSLTILGGIAIAGVLSVTLLVILFGLQGSPE